MNITIPSIKMGILPNGTIEMVNTSCEINEFVFKSTLQAAIQQFNELLTIIMFLNGLLFVFCGLGLIPNNKIKNPLLRHIHTGITKYVAYLAGIGISITIFLMYFVQIGMINNG